MDRRRRPWSRWLAALLSAAMVLSGSGMSALADQLIIIGDTPSPIIDAPEDNGQDGTAKTVDATVRFYEAEPGAAQEPIAEVTVTIPGKEEDENQGGDAAEGDSETSTGTTEESDPNQNQSESNASGDTEGEDGGDGTTSEPVQPVTFAEVLEKFEAEHETYQSLSWSDAEGEVAAEKTVEGDMDVWLTPFKVTFYKADPASIDPSDGEALRTNLLGIVSGVASGSYLGDAIARFEEKNQEAYPEYVGINWSLGDGYIVAGDVAVWDVSSMEAAAMVEANGGSKTFTTLQAALDSIGYRHSTKDDHDYTEEYSINGEPIPNDGTVKITLLKDVTENVTETSKNFELDMRGHTVTAADSGKRAFSIINDGASVTLKNGIITGTTKASFDNVYGLYVNGNVSAAKGSFKGENLQIKGNNAGILFRYGQTITLSNVRVESSASDGGIIIADGVNLTADKLVVKDNTNLGTTSDRYNGGGIFVRTSGNTLVLNDSTITGNAAGGSSGGFSYPRDGAGIYLTAGSSLELNNCTISGNTAKKSGGGIYSNGSVTIKDSILSNNTGAQGGGGIYAASKATTELSAVQITGNAVTNTKYSGGGIYSLGSLSFNNGCSVKDNTAASASGVGGIYVGGSISKDETDLTFSGNNNYSLYFGSIPATELSGLTITGNKAGSVVGSKMSNALTLTDCNFVDNTLTSNYCTFSTTGSGNITFKNCRFERNGAPYVSYEFSNSSGSGTTTFENCQIRNNTGQYSYGILAGEKGKVIVRDTVITGHTKHGVEVRGSFEMESGALYGNAVGDILVSTTGTSLTVPAAKDMKDEENADIDFTGYTWNEQYEASDGTSDKDQDLEVGTSIAIQAADMKNKKDHIYTAALPSEKYVAQLKIDGSEAEKFETVQAAIDAVKEHSGESCTVKLIRKEERGREKIYENVTIPTGVTVTLDMNGHELYSNGAPFVIEKGANLTLTNESGKKTSSGYYGRIYRKDADYRKGTYALVNYGKLTVGPSGATSYWPPSIYSIDFSDGEALTLPRSLQITQAIRLGKGKQIALTYSKNTSKTDAPVIVLDPDVINNLNTGTGEEANGVVIYQAVETSVTIDTKFSTYTEARLRSGGVTSAVGVSSEKDENNMARVVARPRILEGVYLNGSSGKDDLGTGDKGSPVKTFAVARELLLDQLEAYERERETNPDAKKPQGIYISGAVTISGKEEWSFPDTINVDGKEKKVDVKVIRATGYTGELVTIPSSTSLTLKNITIDGYGAEGIKAKEALIKITSATGTLNIEEGTLLTNNYHTVKPTSGYTYSGGAINCRGGKVNMNGGTIKNNAALYGGGIEMYGGTLTMNGGTISNNSAVVVDSYDAAGGGVCLLYGATFELTGGSISNNTSSGVGGGISVGGHIDSTMTGKESLHMEGAVQVNENSAAGCGGGIFIQSRGKAEVYGGEIKGNEAALAKNPFISSNGLSIEYGGGGIYVNGGRAGYATGELYLKNVQVTGNSSVDGGNGFAGCGTSATKIYLTDGGAIYNNGSGSQVLIANDGVSYVSDVMLGDIPYNWKYADGTKVPLGSLQNIVNRNDLYLNNQPAGEPADGLVKVVISGNTSGTRGGGIGSNGFVQIGSGGASVVIPVTKTVENADLSDGQYSFVLKDENGVVIDEQSVTRTEKGIGEAKFVVSYSELGTYKYTLEEVQGDVPGITYSTAVYDVTVEVTEAGGVWTSQPGDPVWVTKTTIVRRDSGEEVKEATFNNTYDANGTLELEASKVLEGRDVKKDEFSFSIVQTNQNGKPLKDADGKTLYEETVTNGDDGVITFPKIDFKLADDGQTYYYKVSEVLGTDGEAGITYDKTVYTVTVTVSNKGDGTLDVQKTITNAAGETVSEIVFNNTYEADGSLALDATKNVNNAAPGERIFSFELKDAAGTVLQTKSNDAAGKVTFDAIKYTLADIKETGGEYTYTVSEVLGTDGEDGITYDKAVYTVKVKVSDNGDGTLDVQKTITDAAGNTVDAITFNNPYEAKGSVALDATKTVNNAAPGERIFSFELKDAEGTVLQTKSNNAAGKVTFDAIGYTLADDGKEYTYTVSEVLGTDGEDGITYDKAVYTVKVKVSDNGDGTLDVQKTITNAAGETVDAMEFDNTYDANGTLALTAQKTVNDAAPGERTFSFTIVQTDAEGNALEGAEAYTQTVQNAADGTVSFPEISYKLGEDGTYYYTVSEVLGTDGEDGITYDKTVYTVEVAVADDGKGTMTATPVIKDAEGNTVDAMAFDNTYDANGTLALTAQKTVNDAAPGERTFSFTIVQTDAEGNALEGAEAYTQTVQNAADGTVTFPEISYKLGEDGTYYYTVSEVLGTDGEDGITYDKTVYTVEVTVADNGKGTMTATPVIKDAEGNTVDAMAFANTYDANGTLTLTAQKTVNGAAPGERTFSFTIVQTDAEGNALEGEEAYTQTVQNTADGTVSFPEISYKLGEDGTYYYKVSEDAGTDGEDGITYDKTVYTVEVAVADDGKGTMTATPVIKDAEGNTVDAMAFANTYDANGTLALTATKTLEGGTLAAGQFSFTLTQTDADGNALEDAEAYTETVQNAADGSIAFTPLQYTLADDGKDFYYIVSEQAGTDAQVVYDQNFYIVQVHVADNGKGVMEATAAYTTAAGPAEGIAFTNRQLASLTVTKQLTNNDTPWAPTEEPLTYYVALYEDEALTRRVSEVKPIVFNVGVPVSSVEFTGLEPGKTYYVGETDANGTTAMGNGDATTAADGSEYSAYFGNGNRVTLQDVSGTTVFFENVFLRLPNNYYREGMLTVTKRLLGADGREKAGNQTFYAGIFADEAHTMLAGDVTQNIVALNLGGGSAVSTTVGVTITEESAPRTLYVTEVDVDGRPVTNAASFQYNVTVDGAEVTFTLDDNQKSVTITNQEQEEEETETEVTTETEEKTEVTTETETSTAKTVAAAAAKTGDDTPILPLVILLAAAVLVIVLVGVKRRKRS